MKNTQNKIIVNLAGTYEEGSTYYIGRVADADALINLGNSQKFADAIANKVVIVNSSAFRVKAANNPHIADKLKNSGVDCWRIDGGTDAFTDYKRIDRVSVRRDYVVDFDNLTTSLKLMRKEVICPHCHNIRTKAQMHGVYCEQCLTEASSNSVCLARRFSYHDYSGGYPINEKIDEANTIVFGTEIERDFVCESYDVDFYDTLNEALLKSCDLLYKFNKTRQPVRDAVFMHDGSLTNGGVEWITFPHTYAHYKKNAATFDAVLENMRQYYFTSSNRTGNHIHINRSYFDGVSARDKDKSRFAAAKIAVILAENWDEFCAIAKRDIHNCGYTEKPTQKKTDNVFTIARKTLDYECSHNTAVNLQHRDTIELRIFGGIDSAADLLFILDITNALARFAKHKSLEKAQSASVVDICRYLIDKKEHGAEIVKRLTDKGLTAQAEKVTEYLQTITGGADATDSSAAEV